MFHSSGLPYHLAETCLAYIEGRRTGSCSYFHSNISNAIQCNVISQGRCFISQYPLISSYIN